MPADVLYEHPRSHPSEGPAQVRLFTVRASVTSHIGEERIERSRRYRTLHCAVRIGACILCALVASCSDSKQDLESTPVGREIVRSYKSYLEVRIEANLNLPNPDNPDLRKYAASAQLTQVVNEARLNLEDGVKYRLRSHPADLVDVDVVSIEGGVAELKSCVVDDTLRVQRETGEVLNDDVVTLESKVKLLRMEGRWRVAESETLDYWYGVEGCASESG